MSAQNQLTFAPMLITDVFESMASSSAWYDKSKLAPSKEPASYPFISRTRSSNGVDGFCAKQEKEPEAGNAITVGLDTQTVAYQPVAFYTSQNIQVLRHPELNRENGLVLTRLIAAQMGRFSWGGNGATLGRLKKTRIMTPVMISADGQQAVDWNGMSRFGAELTHSVAARTSVVRKAAGVRADADLPELVYEPIYVIDVPGQQHGIFRAHKGKRLITAHRRPGRTPFVAGSRVNNSIVDLADVPALFPAGWLTLIYNGDGGTGHAKYQPMPFSASDDVTALEPISSEATEDALLMMVTLLTQQCVPKFGFGYKLTLHRLGRQRIMAPVKTDANGQRVVDWGGMTLYGQILRARAESRLDSSAAGSV